MSLASVIESREATEREYHRSHDELVLRIATGELSKTEIESAVSENGLDIDEIERDVSAAERRLKLLNDIEAGVKASQRSDEIEQAREKANDELKQAKEKYRKAHIECEKRVNEIVQIRQAENMARRSLYSMTPIWLKEALETFRQARMQIEKRVEYCHAESRDFEHRVGVLENHIERIDSTLAGLKKSAPDHREGVTQRKQAKQQLAQAKESLSRASATRAEATEKMNALSNRIRTLEREQMAVWPNRQCLEHSDED